MSIQLLSISFVLTLNRVNHSKNPIVKPPTKPNDPKKEDEARRALRKAQEALTRKLTGSMSSYFFIIYLFAP